jgi:hypothetical protein
MTKQSTPYITPGSNNLHIPSRSEFLRLTSNLLTTSDFCTDYSSGYAIDKVSSAIRWTYSNEKRRSEIVR